MQVDL